MKKLLVMGLFGVLSGLASAESIHSLSIKNKEDNCINLARTAQVFMKFKQDGVSIISALESVDKTIKDKPRADILKLVIRDAYSQPNYYTQSIKERQLNEFSNRYYLDCAKGQEK